MSLEERVKALENWRDNIIAAFIGAPQTVQPTQAAAFKPETAEHIITQLNGWITTTEYIHDKALFARINEDLKAHGYKYVSAGKDTHWERAQ